MNSVSCNKCSLVNFSSSEVCRRCGEPLSSVDGNESHAEPAPFETQPTESSYTIAAQPDGQANQFQLSDISLQTHSVPSKGKGVVVTLLALVCLVALIGIPTFMKSRGVDEFANLSWKEYKPDDGSYSILLPGEPQRNIASQATPVGNIQANTYTVKIGGRTAFIGGYFEYPAAMNVPIDAFIEKNLDATTALMRGTIISRKRITIDGHQVLEAEIKPPAGIGRDGDKRIIRIYFAWPRIYMFMASGPDSPEAVAARAKYLDSFKLLKGR